MCDQFSDRQIHDYVIKGLAKDWKKDTYIHAHYPCSQCGKIAWAYLCLCEYLCTFGYVDINCPFYVYFIMTVWILPIIVHYGGGEGGL